jgi:hypothetical protein
VALVRCTTSFWADATRLVRSGAVLEDHDPAVTASPGRFQPLTPPAAAAPERPKRNPATRATDR